MNKPIHTIYIPGLGDTNPTLQARAVRTWRLYGVTSELVHMDWAKDEPWKVKLDRLLTAIDNAAADDRFVALVGASAGGTAAIHAFAARKDKVKTVVLIAGKINKPETVGEQIKKKNPAYIAASQECPAALESLSDRERGKILSLHAIKDEVVPKAHSFIPGATNRQVLAIGHVMVIATQITLGAYSFIKFIKNIAGKTAG